MVTFMHLMDSVWNISGKDIIAAFDLSSFKEVCDLEVTILELPEVVQTAKKHFITDTDWNIAFLEGGGVLLVKVLLNEIRSGPLTCQFYLLNMLVQTEGKERSACEYSKLLADSG
ncbi:hypothetical protein XELAEV_18011760mg [Xenopus laevis]|uniref:O-methyltransferase C-terminal domain-containing protein n=1 Tax=Xenopus laevis TaxID=8355 RepID=A0A974HY32_XENLA|nr:hypothetical protein XELAEV_18011760mg [Xenopus laevis]